MRPSFYAPLLSLFSFATARALLLTQHQVHSLAGINDYPNWVIDLGDEDLCGNPPDCTYGKSQIDGAPFMYPEGATYARVYGECDVPDIDIYLEDDGVHRPYIAGGDGSVIGTCTDQEGWTCGIPSFGYENRRVVLKCEVEF